MIAIRKTYRSLLDLIVIRKTHRSDPGEARRTSTGDGVLAKGAAAEGAGRGVAVVAHLGQNVEIFISTIYIHGIQIFYNSLTKN